MTLDLSQFHQVFFDEAAEHLETMESLLLKIDVDAPDADDLNAIFRAAHSIKGGSGTFGFMDVTEFTHVMENLLDRVRKSELTMTREMVDVLLRSGDLLRVMLGAHNGGDAADASEAAALIAKLKVLSSGSGASPQPGAANSEKVAAPLAGEVLTKRCYRIEYRGETDDATRGALVEELGALGALNVLQGEASRGAALSLMIETAADESELRGLFEFIATPDAVSIVEVSQQEFHQSAAKHDDGFGFFDAAPGAPEAPAKDPGYGFFEEIATVPSAETKTSAGDDPGYGFFTEVPEPVVKSHAVTVTATEPPSSAPAPVKLAAVESAPKKREEKAAAAASSENSSIRVSIEKVDQLINLVGELVITQSMLVQQAGQLDPVLFEPLISGMAQLERNTRDLQESVMSIRMMPIAFVFSRFPRVVRDLASKLNKQVELKTVGDQTELDKGVIEKITDPLTHLVRNSLDHGLEPADERLAAGKPPLGTVTLKAFHQGGNIVIQVIDDGRGLNREKLLAKAKERGMKVSDALSDQEVYGLIFEAGFSTAAKVTDVSGRGVGMDVVRKNIQSLGGRVEIDSELGKGTTISIRLPLTLAILDGISVGVGNEMFIIPLTFISESLQPTAADIKTIAGKGLVMQVRNEFLPVISLHEVMGLKPKVTQFHQGIMVIIESETRRVALFVDELVGQHQVVIKSLEHNYRKVKGVSGATIMGDGKVAMILDAAAIAQMAQPGVRVAA